jgi:hypothetical protein
MSTKSHAHTRCGTLRKSSISTRGYAEIHISALGRFWQFWAEFAALAVADSMLKDHLKSLKPHNF